MNCKCCVLFFCLYFRAHETLLLLSPSWCPSFLPACFHIRLWLFSFSLQNTGVFPTSCLPVMHSLCFHLKKNVYFARIFAGYGILGWQLLSVRALKLGFYCLAVECLWSLALYPLSPALVPLVVSRPTWAVRLAVFCLGVLADSEDSRVGSQTTHPEMQVNLSPGVNAQLMGCSASCPLDK